jgi:hypothetical protein
LDGIVFNGRKCFGYLSDRLEMIIDNVLISSGGLASRTGIAPPTVCITLQRRCFDQQCTYSPADYWHTVDRLWQERGNEQDVANRRNSNHRTPTNHVAARSVEEYQSRWFGAFWVESLLKRTIITLINELIVVIDKYI